MVVGTGCGYRRSEVKRILHLTLGLCVVVGSMGASGCGLHRLKDSNRRLKESNDRLIAENNRLEETVAALNRQLADLKATPPEVAALESKDPGMTNNVDLQQELLLPEEVDVVSTPGGVRMTIDDRVFFSLGQATLTRRGRSTLDKVARALQNNYAGKMIRVDGHTDDTPIRKVRAKYPTNWELSTARACTVVRYLVDKGINPKRIFPAGFSYYKPASYGRSAKDKGRNRRVEILVYDDKV